MSTPEYAGRLLAELTAGIVTVPADLRVTDVTLDSRAATPGALFLACRGRTHHGLEFARQAIDRGASAVLFEAEGAPSLTPPNHIPVQASQPVHPCTGVRSLDCELTPRFAGEGTVIAVPELSRHLGTIADRFFAAPSEALNVVGFTGTNGKTTCAYLLAQALTLCGRRAGYVGTLGFGLPAALEASAHTTPDVVSVHRELDTLRRLGATCVCMEVSSHALDQHRVDGVRFNTAVFTNLTHDHLDYHGTMEEYAAAKARLFAWPGLQWRVLNIDDRHGSRLSRQTSSAHLITTTRASPPPRRVYGSRTLVAGTRDADYVYAPLVQPQPAGLSIEIESSWGNGEIRVPLIGDFNADNVLVVLAVLCAWGVPFADAARALAQCHAPSGRMETFGGDGATPLVIVDYAHTPDALSNALQSARMHCSGKVHVVFGCGGDRDTAKRPLMGKIAAQLADDVILTDDNPRSEDPGRIIADIRGGIPQNRSAQVEHDRERAIHLAFSRASAGDVVLIAGKGHEDYQIYGHERRAFSDQAVVRAQLGKQA